MRPWVNISIWEWPICLTKLILTLINLNMWHTKFMSMNLVGFILRNDFRSQLLFVRFNWYLVYHDCNKWTESSKPRNSNRRLIFTAQCNKSETKKYILGFCKRVLNSSLLEILTTLMTYHHYLFFFRLYKVVYHRNNWNYFASFGNSCNGYLRQEDKEVSWKF